MEADKKLEFPDGTKDAALSALADLRTKVLKQTQHGSSRRWLADLLFQDVDTAMTGAVLPVARSRFELTHTRWTELMKRRKVASDDDNSIWGQASKNVDEAIRAVADKLSAANDDRVSAAARGRTQAGCGSAAVKLRTGDGRWALRISGPLQEAEGDEKRANIYLLPEIIDRSAISAEAASASSAATEKGNHAGRVRGVLRVWFEWTRRIRHRAWPLLVSVLAAAAFTWALVASLNRPEPSEVRLDLSTTDSVHLAWGNLQAFGISPVCGCPNEVDPNEWWGISGLARNVGLERIGGGPYTKYSLFGPGASEVRVTPDAFKTSARVFVVKHSFGHEGFDARLLLSGKLPDGYQIVTMEDIEEPFISIIAKSHIHVDILGKVPAFAMLPLEGSNVFIDREVGMYADAPSRLRITEHYSGWPHKFAKRPIDSRIEEFPAVDFVGPDIVFWTDSDHNADIVTPQKVFHGPRPSENEVIGVFITKPPFATRVSIMPLTERERDREVAAPNPKFTYPSLHDDGGVRLTILNPADVAREYSDIREFAQRHPVMAVTGIPLWPSEIPVEDINNPGGPIYRGRVPPGTKTRMEFRYPPLPPQAGFNVFGPLFTLGINKAVGSVSLGHSRAISLDQSIVEMGNFSEINRDRGVLALPVDRNDAIKANFRATGDVFVDGKALSRPLQLSSLSGREIGYLTGALVSFALAIFFAVRLRRRSSGARAKHDAR